MATIKKDIIEKMQTIANRKVKHYKSDFEIDKNYIYAKDYNNYIWIVRSCGTYLLPLDEILGNNKDVIQLYNYCYDENKREAVSHEFDFKTGQFITKKHPKKHTFYFIDIKNNVVKEIRKDKTIKDLHNYYSNYIKKVA